MQGTSCRPRTPLPTERKGEVVGEAGAPVSTSCLLCHQMPGYIWVKERKSEGVAHVKLNTGVKAAVKDFTASLTNSHVGT